MPSFGSVDFLPKGIQRGFDFRFGGWGVGGVIGTKETPAVVQGPNRGDVCYAGCDEFKRPACPMDVMYVDKSGLNNSEQSIELGAIFLLSASVGPVPFSR